MKNFRLRLLLLCVTCIISLGASATPGRDYLCFTAEKNGSTVELIKNGNAYNAILQYSTDDCENWVLVDFSSETTTGTIMLDVGRRIYFRNTRTADEVPGFSKDDKGGYNHYQFVMRGKISASGNVMSLVDSDVETTTIPSEYCFYGLFEDCRSLISAPELPAYVLKRNCYENMFKGCTNLVKAPELPATRLAEYCYESMFSKCTSLAEAPVLPAMELKRYCYYCMFERCESLTEAPALPATTLVEDCYNLMFYECTGLTSAPALPAEKLAEYCYSGMFKSCTNLNLVKASFTEWMDYATDNWLDGVAEEGTFICPDALDKATTGTGNIPDGWTAAFEVKANSKPETHDYYTTFHSGKNAYQVPGDMTAYTAVAHGSILLLTPVANGIIPAGEAVVLKCAQSKCYLPYTTGTATKSSNNALKGTDKAADLGANDYALSLGQDGVGFYPWNGKPIGANKAYLPLGGIAPATTKALGIEFED